MISMQSFQATNKTEVWMCGVTVQKIYWSKQRKKKGKEKVQK